MEDEARIRLLGGKVPDDDVGLEAHVGDLARGEVAATAGHGQAGDVVVVADEEVLVARLQVLHHDVAADRVDHVHAVRVDLQAVGHFALEADGGLEL